jgi:hypothetical protein
MATDEYSFDVGCNVDLQEVSNAVTQALKEISQRFDFKGSKSTIEIDKGAKAINVVSDDEFKLNSVLDILKAKLIKRSVALNALNHGKVEQIGGGLVRQNITIQNGIPMDKAKEMVKMIKDMKLKVNAEIQSDQVRVKGKKKDDLQAILTMLKSKDLGIHVEFTNYR